MSSNCNLFNDSLLNIVGSSGFTINKSWLQSLVPPFNADTSGVWYPIIINHSSSRSEYGSLLSNPQKINDSITDPCNCNSVGRSLARNTILAYNDFSEDAENGVFCEYCQKLYNTNTGVMNCVVDVDYRPRDPNGENSTIQWPILGLTPVPIGSGENYNVKCCNGGCDTRMLTDDIVPKIPYLSNSYINKFFDFKHLKQFPSIENPGLGIERFGSYTGPTDRISLSNATVHFDWILKPRLGEVPPAENDTYHSNLYVHEQSYSRYLLNNKTCGNFILQKINAPTPISMWQSGNMPMLSGSPLLSGISTYTPEISDIIPTASQFTIPYGISDDTHYNIFLKAPYPKQGGLWKWNFTSGVLCWYRYYDRGRTNDSRVIPGVDLYISPGDVFFAKNDGPEPLVGTTGTPQSCKHRVCPSGLKMTSYQTNSTSGTVTILPSGSEFIYISNNIYPYVYSFVQFFMNNISNNPDIDTTNITYNDLLRYASIMATGPLYSEITVSLYNIPGATEELDANRYINILNKKGINNSKVFTIDDINQWFSDTNNADKVRDQYYRLVRLNKRLTDKKMPSYNNLNMIATTGDLVNTLVDKYGLYVWVPPDTNATITLNNAIYPHAYFDIDFETAIKLRDTRSAVSSIGQPKNCNLQLRGRTKIFGYDQGFEIGESKLKATILDDNLVYAAEYIGSPPVRTITDVSATMSTYFRDKPIYSTAFGSYQTSIVDIYSRFPSVSSSLDTTFSNLSNEQDGFGDVDVFFLTRDAQYRFTRKYDGFCAHPNISLAGFHEDGGFYYESTLLDKNAGAGTVGFQKNWRPPRAKNNPIIKFNTYDLGIKLYSININKLRNSSSLSCKTFPLDQSCSCWGINKITNFPFKCGDTVVYETSDFFVPFLSTQNVQMLSYGGYDETAVNSYLGNFRIPNHPSVGTNLPNINKVIDPENTNGCISTVSISLPNYISSTWRIEIPNFDTNNASIWVRYTDSFNFATDRTQNKLVINGQEIFPNEQKILNTSSNTLEISIHNQFLSNVADGVLYHGNIYSCSLDSVNDPYDRTPKYMKPSTVNITFGRIPNSTILALQMPGIQSMGQLTKTFFDPNIGLVSSGNNGSALNIDKFNGLFNFDYGQKLFNNRSDYTPIKPNDISLSGSMSISSLGKLLSFVNIKNESKKLRLYLKVNNKWHEYEEHRTFGYFNTQEQQQYHSWPTFFTQCHLQTDQAFGPFVQAIPKVPLEHVYCTNAQTFQSIVRTSDEMYPYFDHSFSRDGSDKKIIRCRGARPYFMFPNISGISKSVDNDNYLINNTINVINEEKFTYLQDFRYRYYIVSKSTVNLEPITIYSISNKDINAYRIDGDKRQSMPQGFDLSSEVKPNKIVKKRLYIVNTSDSSYGNLSLGLLDDNELSQRFITEFELEQDHPHTNGYIYLLKSGEMPITNLTIHPTVRAFNIPSEQTIRYSNDSNERNIFSNKWGDLIYYNNTSDILNNRPYYYSIDDVYGPFLYDNTMNYIMANNFMYSHQIPSSSGTVTNKFPINMYIKNTGSTGLVSFDSPRMSYYLHQPYSVGGLSNRQDNSIDRFNLFKNQNPILDINLYETGSLTDRAFVKAGIQEYDPTGIGMTGILFISGIYRPTYEYPKLISDNFDFFVNLNSKFYLKPTPITDNGFVSKSLVITDTYTTLETIILQTNIDTTRTTNCTNVVVPNVGTTLSLANNIFDWSNFRKTSATGSVYASYPVLCDSDVAGDCGAAETCNVSTVGSVSVSSKYNNYQYKYKNISSINSSTIDYAITVDAGLYCPLSSSGAIPYIIRSVVPGYSMVFPTRTLDGTSSCIDGTAYPPLERGLSVWDDNFQSDVTNNITTSQNVDHWANETLFRAIHGTRQNINLNNISSYNSSSSIKSYADILQSLISSPNNSLSILYDNIPYDYDTSATAPNFELQGAIRIYGPAAIGDVIKITYNDNVYNIRIKDDGNDVYVECAELEAKGLIMEKTAQNTTIYVREAGTPSSVPGAVERVISTCDSPLSYGVSTTCAYGGDSTFTDSVRYIASPWCIGNQATEVFVPNTYSVTTPRISNTVPCSAFPKSTASPESASPLDSFFSKNRASIAIAGSAGLGGGSPLECAGYYFNTCRVKTNCCEGQTNVISNISYRIKDCHYDFTMHGLLTKSINNIGQVTNTYGSLTCSTPFSTNNVSWTERVAEWTRRAECYCDCGNPFMYFKNTFTELPQCAIDLGDDYLGEDNPNRLEPFSYIYMSCCQLYCGVAGGNYSIGHEPDTSYDLYTITCQEGLVVTTSTNNSVSYEVVESTTTSTPTSNIYDPNVIRTICTFIYDNNEIKLYTGIAKTRNGVEVYNGGNCASLSTNSCPSISIVLPNSNYGIDDTISSSCPNCPSQNDKIKILDNPRWESQVDTVYCLLAAEVIGGSKNPSNFTHEFQCIPPDRFDSGFRPPTQEEKDAYQALIEAKKYDRGRVCGQKVDQSCTEWHHFASNPIMGNGSRPDSHCNEVIAVENAYHVNIPDWTTNGDAVQAFTEGFRARMEQIYRSQHYCSNSYEYSEDQLIEGVIPGSCSLEFATISWPMTAVKLCGSFDDQGAIETSMQEEEASLNITIAYMKYQYKHPVNITDKIIDNAGDIPSNECRVYFSTGGVAGCRKKYFGNMKEKLQSTERETTRCVSDPTCYDKSRPCDPTNGCCRIDQTAQQYFNQ
jgi:hypothetical protein